MWHFEVLEPRDVREACRLLADNKEAAKLMAGGQSLLPVLKHRLARPRFVISIKHLAELAYIKEAPDGVRIGALTTHRQLETSPLIRERFPVLVDMERRLGMVQIRNWGTLGGNLCHADPVSDPPPPLIALGASVKTLSVRGERQVALGEFFTGYLETVLEPDEILVEIEIPNPAPRTGSAFLKEQVRASDMAIASVAATITLDGATVREARIALGGVGDRPLRAETAEGALAGRNLHDAIEEAAQKAGADAEPSPDVQGSVEYKRHLVSVLARTVLGEAVRRARS